MWSDARSTLMPGKGLRSADVVDDGGDDMGMNAIATNQFVGQESEIPDRGRMTQDEVAALAEATAQKLLGVSTSEAFAMLERGELDGTFAESVMRSLKFLLNA
jgi:hypothetical protein